MKVKARKDEKKIFLRISRKILYSVSLRSFFPTGVLTFYSCSVSVTPGTNHTRFGPTYYCAAEGNAKPLLDFLFLIFILTFLSFLILTL